MESAIKQTTTGQFYQASDPPHLFRRIVGGLSWPPSGASGFLVVLGEDQETDFFFKVRHVRLLHEQQDLGGQAFVTMDPLLRAAVFTTEKFKVGSWFAPRGLFDTEINRFNRDQAALRQAQVRPLTPPGDPSMEYYVSLVRKRTYDQKTLHLGQSSLMPRLASLPDDLSTTRFENYPEVSALLFALAGLDLLPDRGAQAKARSRTRAAADPAAGY